jgi:hypothetical protein
LNSVYENPTEYLNIMMEEFKIVLLDSNVDAGHNGS